MNHNVMVWVVTLPAGLTVKSGFYQGGEVVTARARAYAEGKLGILSSTCFLVLFFLLQKGSRTPSLTMTKTLRRSQKALTPD